MTLNALIAWMAGTPLSLFVRSGAWPVLEILHFVGLALLVGVAGMMDLRLLGVARGIPLRALNDLIPWAIAGFAINIVTGVLFVFGFPERYFTNPAFQLKMVFIAINGINVLLFNTVLFRTAMAVGPGEDAPPIAKVIGAVSLFCWFAVMCCGRLLPYVGAGY